MPPKKLTAKQRDALLHTLRARFDQHEERHGRRRWADVEERLRAAETRLWSLHRMEETGGEPDVVGSAGSELVFMDCAPESPKGRRSLCYDREALEARKEHKPQHSALGLAAEMGVEVLEEGEYRALQELGSFDQKTASWLRTPPEVRQRGGAIFGDLRYGRVFVYHNGAESYYAARGFRASLRI
jgi:hypothetical protein